MISKLFKFLSKTDVYTHFDSFIPDTYKIGMIYFLPNRCFHVCSSWSMSHQQLILLREIFHKNGYPENFIDSFKLFLNRIHILKEKVPTVEKNPQRLVLKLGLNCKSPSKGYSTAANYKLFLKVKINSVIFFALKTLFPKFLHQVWFRRFSVDYAINPITEDVLGILL